MKNWLGVLLVLTLIAVAFSRRARAIDTSCGNYAQIAKVGRHWAYWCHGRGKAWRGDFFCDCLRNLLFQRKRLACERSGSGRQNAEDSIMRSCERIKNAIDFTWLYDCKRGVDAACRLHWPKKKYRTGLCDKCNGKKCRGDLVENFKYDDWCGSFKVLLEDPEEK